MQPAHRTPSLAMDVLTDASLRYNLRVMPTRHWLGVGSKSPEQMQTALGWLVDATTAGETALLVVHARNNAEERSIIGEALGAQATKALAKGEAVRFGKGTLQLVTLKRSKPAGWAGGPVLVAWATQDLLDLVDRYDRATAILAIAWGDDEELAAWVRTWNVPRLGEVAGAPQPLVSNPVVQRALKDVIPSINISTGASHPSDHAAIVHMFRVLKDNNEGYDPEEVRGWLIAEVGMHPRSAEAIREIAAKIRAGRAVRTRHPYRRDDAAIKRWRAKT
jgi:hypothetical protein